MKVVFVHGVANRREPDPEAFQKAIDARHRSFSEWCFEREDIGYFDPYWGDLGAHPDKDLASIPRGPTVALGLEGLRVVSPGGSEEGSLDNRVLLEAAKDDFGAFLTALAAAEMESGDANSLARADLLARYAADLDDEGGDRVETPNWVASASNDAELLKRLQEELDGFSGMESLATLGLGDWLKKAGKKVVSGALGLVDGPAERLARAATPHIARFFGDVFIYLKNGARRADIRQRITDDLTTAARASIEDGQKLMVVGHSMGAIILYDILSDQQIVDQLSEEVGTPFAIDLLLTVGTQVGVFEELDLFAHSKPGVTPGRPPCVGTWWHVYNQMDVLSFGVAGVIEGVQQFSVDTGANIVDAHGAYFTSPVFHRRLRKRMKNAGLIV
ncbi:MAG: hypothetical protein ABGW84_02900 [Sphingomonadaceae bacterium]